MTFDGGKTWATYAIPYTQYNFTGDPAIAFDATGRAYYATLGFMLGQGFVTGTNPDVVVATSADGGKSFGEVKPHAAKIKKSGARLICQVGLRRYWRAQGGCPSPISLALRV